MASRVRETGVMFAWIGTVGALFQIAGLLIAVAGVNAVHKTITGRGLWGTVADDLVATARRSEPQEVTGSANVTLGAATSAGLGFVQTKEPSEDATLDEQIAYLREQVRHLVTYQAQAAEFTGKALADVRRNLDRVAHLSESRTAELRSHLETVKEALAGKEGTGLHVTMLGLLVTLLGMVLTVF